MNLDSLPKGKDFRISSGPESFAKKLRFAVRFGNLQSLHGAQEAIISALKAKERSIRLGTFDRLGRSEVLRKIKETSGVKITGTSEQVIKKVLSHLSDQSGAVKISEAKDKIEEEIENRHRMAAESRRRQAAGIGEDGRFKLNKEENGNYAANDGLRRGALSRAEINYSRMSKLGSSEAARNLQKSAYSKLQSAGGGATVVRSSGGRIAGQL